MIPTTEVIVFILKKKQKIKFVFFSFRFHQNLKFH
jgi:hypothetical protein